MRTKKRNKVLKSLLLASLILVAASAGFWGVTRLNSDGPKSSPTKGASNVDLSPATEEEIKDSEQHKDAAVNNEDIKISSSKRKIQPVIVDAGQYGNQIEVRSYISGIVESGGVCTATFTHGTSTFTRQSTGTSDATTTLCPKITLQKEDFPVSGTWSVTIAYLSNAAYGNSSNKSFEVN